MGSIVTTDELYVIQDTLRSAADLDNLLLPSKSRKKGAAGDDTSGLFGLRLDEAKNGENGYLLDDEMYSSLRSYMTVQLEKPVDKFRRVAQSVKSLASRIKTMTDDNRGDHDHVNLTEVVPSSFTAGVTRWSFNVFDLEDALVEADCNSGLVWVCETLIRKAGLMDTLNIDSKSLRCWLMAVSDSYHSDNSYHNSMHGADVCQTMYCLVENSHGLKLALNNKTKLCAFLAATAHDVSHGGKNNNFLVNSDDPLAITYHYDSPLEHMHAAKAFELMRLPGCDVLSFFGEWTRRDE